MRICLYALTVILELSAAQPMACAQDTDTPDPSRPTEDDLRTANFTFRCAGWNSLEETLFYQFVETEDPEKARSKDPVFVPLKIHEMTPTRRFPQKAGQGINFYRMVAAPPASTTDPIAPALQYRKVGTSAAPSGTRRMMFLFFPKSEDGTYKIYPIRDDRKDSPFGAYQFHNLAKEPIRGGLGERKFVCQPGTPLSLKFDFREKRQLPFATWTGQGETLKWLQRNTFSYNPNKHLKYFFYPTADRNGRVRLTAKGLVEFYTPPPPTGEVVPDPTNPGNAAEPPIRTAPSSPGSPPSS